MKAGCVAAVAVTASVTVQLDHREQIAWGVIAALDFQGVVDIASSKKALCNCDDSFAKRQRPPILLFSLRDQRVEFRLATEYRRQWQAAGRGGQSGREQQKGYKKGRQTHFSILLYS